MTVHSDGTDGEAPKAAEDGAGGAEIIPFPGNFRAASGPEIDEGRARLDRALVALNQALAEQQEAVQAWCEVTCTLADSVRKLAENCRALDAHWSVISSRVSCGDL
jgi:hypothetical protein